MNTRVSRFLLFTAVLLAAPYAAIAGTGSSNTTVKPQVSAPTSTASDSSSTSLQQHGGVTPLAFSVDTTSCQSFTINVGYAAYCPSTEVFAGMKEGTLKTTTTTTTTYSWNSSASCTAWPAGLGSDNCPTFNVTASGWSCSNSTDQGTGAVTTSCSGSCPKATATGQDCESSSTQTIAGCTPDFCPKPTPPSAAHINYVSSTSNTTSKTTTTPVDDGTQTYFCCPQNITY